MSTRAPIRGAGGPSVFRQRGLPGLIVLLVSAAVVYLPSLRGGFLNWDDPWLIADNPVLRDPSLHALHTIWTDFSKSARLALGAEYLPLRDTSVWLEARVDGLTPQVMRGLDLACYLGALGLLRGALRRALGKGLSVEFAVLVFALHPLHVESVAWLAGRKDVLALLFVAAALFVHSGESRFRPLWVPLLLLCASFSKAQSVVAMGFLAAHDLLARRRPDPKIYAPAAVAGLAVALVHAHVGQLVGITTKLAGGTRLNAALTMGEITTRYLGMLVWPARLSLVYDVPACRSLTLASVFGYAVLLGWGIFGLLAVRRDRGRVLLAAWLWFVLPLLPVSQVLFPLQNRMADRYLIFSVLGAGLLLSFAVDRIPTRFVIPDGGKGAERAVQWVAGGVLLSLGLASFSRSRLFADSALAFDDATRKTRTSALAPYLLGNALEDRGDSAGAERAYLEVLRRSVHATEPGRRATNNLARAYARQGRNDEAVSLLERGRRLWPTDPKIIYNLALLAQRRGDSAEASRLTAELRQRFPEYRPGQSSPADFYSGP